MALECLYFGEKDEFFHKMQLVFEQKACSLLDAKSHQRKDDEAYHGLMVVKLDGLGHCNEFYQWLSGLQDKDNDYFRDSVLGLIVKSDSEYHTKKFASAVLFLLNRMGARFPGHSVVEFIKDYANLKKWQLAENLSVDGAVTLVTHRLIEDIINFQKKYIPKPKILVLHASTHDRSNTLALWRMVKEQLAYKNITEYHVEEGTAIDCYGCSFDTCIYYSEQKSCFYGGVITEELLPLIEKSDVIVWICPNYNDAISAKLTAVINRLTVLYRRVSFKEKKIFGIIVSANSGSDSVASQLIDALNINKGFQLPPNFALMALASDEGSINNLPDINERAKEFAKSIYHECFQA